jgi:hypothetical protein
MPHTHELPTLCGQRDGSATPNLLHVAVSKHLTKGRCFEVSFVLSCQRDTRTAKQSVERTTHSACTVGTMIRLVGEQFT